MKKSLKNSFEHLSYLEIIIIDVFRQLDGRHIHASLGSQKVTLVDSSHGTTVQFQGSCKVKEKLDQLQNWFKIISSTVTIATLSSQNNDPKHCMRCIKCFRTFEFLPVTRTSPDANCLRTITRFPLWAPARTIATVPLAKEGLKVLFCLEKNLVEVPLGALKNKVTNQLLSNENTF